MAATHYVYHLDGLTKIYPRRQEGVREHPLAVPAGCKIGVVGVNGSGKSTLLKIMAGLDTEILGEAKAMDGLKIGYLPQEPKLDPARPCSRTSPRQCPEKQMVEEFNAIAAEDRRGLLPTNSWSEMNKLQEEIDAADAWDIDAKIEMAMEALRCPPCGRRRHQALGRREVRRTAICAAAAVQARHDPDGRADQPPRRRERGLAAELSCTHFRGCVILVTHDRYFLDQITTWILELDRGQGIPYEGNYSVWLEKKAKRIAQE